MPKKEDKINISPVGKKAVLHFRKIISQAFMSYKNNFLLFFVIFGVNLLYRRVEMNFRSNLDAFPDVLRITVQVVSFLIAAYLSSIVMKTALITLKKAKIDAYQEIIVPLKVFMKKIISDLIVNLLILLGLFLLVLPSFVVAIRLQFVGYEILHKNIGVWEGFKNSWKNTKGNGFKIFLIELPVILINIICLIFFVPGLFVAYPIIILVQSQLYKNLYGLNEKQKPND